MRADSLLTPLFPFRNGKSAATHVRCLALIYFQRELSMLFWQRGVKVKNAAVTENSAASTEAVQALADNVMAQISDLFQAHAIQPNAVQQQMLASHVRAMALRSLTGEPLPEVEEELFAEIADDAMQLAQQVVDLFGNLPKEETWLLSVHFQVAQENA